MKIKTPLLIAFAILFLVNESAFARAGGRSSGFGGGRSTSYYTNQGSRGSKTYEGGSANGSRYSGMEKSTTAKPSDKPSGTNQNPNQTNNANNSQAQNNPSFFQRHPMMSTFGAALAGTWLGSMLFGSNAGAIGMAGANGGVAGGGGMFSGLMPIILLGLLIWVVIKFANRKSSNGNIINGNVDNQGGFENGGPIGYGQTAEHIALQNIDLPESEKQRFATILVKVQQAWSNQDVATLKMLTTPEMSKYFLDSLNQNQSQNLQNKIENLIVLSTTIGESWEEDNLQYATVVLKWSALDYNINTDKNIDDPLYVSQGDMHNPSEISEAWTFLRYGANGNWILSAIAQVS